MLGTRPNLFRDASAGVAGLAGLAAGRDVAWCHGSHAVCGGRPVPAA
jgi:hypothetical protein